ncbi:hypothetical protein GJ744_006396 [Endocarpon pusillum]|uniref:Cytochrome P450 n=1 Tax=Endocarpon pusillum TaxID=364733 RepID=A0A8H7E6T2_9EURO|nr:hypothetical protein GJ744_006396 [Endocarpon pusillum]
MFVIYSLGTRISWMVMDLFNLLTIAVLVLAIYYFLQFLTPKLDPREPPLISAKIPFIGHVVGLLRYGVPYYAKASAKHPLHPLPAYTLDLFFTKLYVVNSASLVSAVQRHHKTISFDPFLTAAANRLSGITGDGLKLLQETESGGGGINNKVLHSMHPALLGPGLDVMNKNMINNLKASIDGLESGQTSFDLHQWCRHAIGVASTDAVYGTLSPYKDQDIERALWDYESNLSVLLLRILPKITARKAFQAREMIVASFVKYYEAGGQENSSQMTYGRWKTQYDAGATTEDIARLETAAGIGILSNTVPSTFWTLFEIYSRPELLGRLREEISKNALHVDGSSAIHTVDLADIKDQCPLLLSTFQETLRLRSNGAPTRLVYKDIVLNDQYLLKAGRVLQMPSECINRESSTWGATSSEFNPSRFMANGEQKPTNRATGFMSFGASPNICPGRHFATGEIVAMVAMLLLRYDITPINGHWIRPKLNPRAIAASVTPPIEEFRVTVWPRKEFKGTNWAFSVTEGKGRYPLVTG